MRQLARIHPHVVIGDHEKVVAVPLYQVATSSGGVSPSLSMVCVWVFPLSQRPDWKSAGSNRAEPCAAALPASPTIALATMVWWMESLDGKYVAAAIVLVFLGCLVLYAGGRSKQERIDELSDEDC